MANQTLEKEERIEPTTPVFRVTMKTKKLMLLTTTKTLARFEILTDVHNGGGGQWALGSPLF